MSVNGERNNRSNMENFELTNDQRKYFGLNLIENTWERVQWLKTSYIFFDGDTIRKIIHYEPHPNFNTGYIERDYDLHTEKREFIRPKTKRGKPKKVTVSNILAFKPINVSFEWTCYTLFTVNVKCETNSIIIAKTFPNESFDTFEKLEIWVKNYIATVPENHFEQLQIVRNIQKNKKNRIYKQGDIYYYEKEKNRFYFGQILLDLRKILDCGRFPAEKILVQLGRFGLFGTPLIVRGFRIVSDSPQTDLVTILQSGSSGGFYAHDSVIYDNICPIIGNCTVEEKDMAFPMILFADPLNKNHLIFQWGFIEKKLKLRNLLPLIKKNNYEIRYANNVIYHSASVIASKEDRGYMKTDLNSPANSELKNKAFQIMNIPTDLSYNQFAKMENELTVKQIFGLLESKSK